MPLRILIVDDEPSLAKAIMRTLERPFPGAYFGLATRGSEALSLIDTDAPFDVVISDFTMPGITGGELLSRIAARSPCVGLVLCSGGSLQFTDAQVRAQCPAHTSFVPKPFTAEQLVAAVRIAISSVLSL